MMYGGGSSSVRGKGCVVKRPSAWFADQSRSTGKLWEVDERSCETGNRLPHMLVRLVGGNRRRHPERVSGDVAEPPSTGTAHPCGACE
ncbi:hypothetical protein IG631_13779 [Alternaria alternata]|nr:hypothetical protein IG631_13779 [Alternaria alternata]